MKMIRDANRQSISQSPQMDNSRVLKMMQTPADGITRKQRSLGYRYCSWMQPVHCLL